MGSWENKLFIWLTIAFLLRKLVFTYFFLLYLVEKIPLDHFSSTFQSKYCVNFVRDHFPMFGNCRKRRLRITKTILIASIFWEWMILADSAIELLYNFILNMVKLDFIEIDGIPNLLFVRLYEFNNSAFDPFLT